MGIQLFTAIGIIILALVLAKRSIMGPQKLFSRISAIVVFLGYLLVYLAHDESSILIWAGSVLIVLGLLISIWMLLSELMWIVKAYRDNRG